jgi:hypothetical protein
VPENAEARFDPAVIEKTNPVDPEIEHGVAPSEVLIATAAVEEKRQVDRLSTMSGDSGEGSLKT